MVVATEEPSAPVDRAAPTPSVRQSRAAAMGLSVALIALGLGWELAWAPLPGGSGRLALKVLPLALLMPGLVRYRLTSFRLLSMLVWAYAVEGALRLTVERGASQALAGVELLLALLLFSACAWHVRERLKAAPGLA